MENPNWARVMANNKSSKDVLELKQYLWKETSFLPSTATVKQRSWHIINNIPHIIKCEHCKKLPVKYHTSTGYSRFCSKKCSANAETSKAKVRNTNLKKYGKEYGVFVKEIREKMENTNIERYGGKSSLSSPEVRDKIKNTLIENYNVESAFLSPSVREKRKTTMVEKYGTTHALQHKPSYAKMSKTMQSRYGVKYPLQNKEINNKSRNTMRTKFDRDHHKQAHISKDTLKLLNDVDYLWHLHHSDKLSISAIAAKLNVSERTVSARFDILEIAKVNHFVSQKELEFLEFINNKNIDCNPNDRTAISPQELDFYFPKHNFAVEFNGLYWHSEHQKPRGYHADKYINCKDKGIKLVQFFEDEIVNKSNIIKNKILYETEKLEERIYARKCNIVKLSYTEKRDFFEDTHIQGNGKTSINYGLTYNDEIVAAIGFSRIREGRFLLGRFSTSTVVVGAFSRLLKHFENNHSYSSLITFADLRYSCGDLYEHNEFEMVSQLRPDYYWVKNLERFHKFNFRHNTGLKKLEKYDPSLSETENMHNHGFYKIFDAGKLKFEKHAK